MVLNSLIPIVSGFELAHSFNFKWLIMTLLIPVTAPWGFE